DSNRCTTAEVEPRFPGIFRWPWPCSVKRAIPTDCPRVRTAELAAFWEDSKMFKRTILALSVAALTFTGVAQAQENATLTLRNGDKINAQLIDLGGVGFTI